MDRRDGMLTKLKESCKVLKELNLPDPHDLEWIQNCIDGLFSFSKFKVGEIVEIAETYPVNEKDSWGWMTIKHLLTEGSKAEVKEVNWDKKGFSYLVTFLEKSYIDYEGKIQPSTDSANIFLGEKWLRKSEEKVSKWWPW